MRARRSHSCLLAVIVLSFAVLGCGDDENVTNPPPSEDPETSHVVAWGDGNFGQCAIPASNADFTAITAGGLHSLGLRSDGTIVAWGYNYYGQCIVPDPNVNFVAVAAGIFHSLALRGSPQTKVLASIWGRVKAERR